VVCLKRLTFQSGATRTHSRRGRVATKDPGGDSIGRPGLNGTIPEWELDPGRMLSDIHYLVFSVISIRELPFD
jgi:hypothetical protein